LLHVVVFVEVNVMVDAVVAVVVVLVVMVVVPIAAMVIEVDVAGADEQRVLVACIVVSAWGIVVMMPVGVRAGGCEGMSRR
jgi:ABC-type long-subunit fatty acid transport system fused permease/ATPase subunit